MFLRQPLLMPVNNKALPHVSASLQLLAGKKKRPSPEGVGPQCGGSRFKSECGFVVVAFQRFDGICAYTGILIEALCGLTVCRCCSSVG